MAWGSFAFLSDCKEHLQICTGPQPCSSSGHHSLSRPSPVPRLHDILPFTCMIAPYEGRALKKELGERRWGECRLRFWYWKWGIHGEICVSLCHIVPSTATALFTAENRVGLPLELMRLENQSRKLSINSENSSQRSWSSGKASGSTTSISFLLLP